jgi:MoaA/NifB/PqqE/SkfB family radical SAM enzyme
MTPRPRDLISGARALLGIITKKWVLTGPRSVALAISDVCDTNCVMCWCHSPLLDRQAVMANAHQIERDSRRQRFMDPAVFETILRESREMGTFRVVLGGNGDPALHPQFDGMLELMEQLEMEPYVLTNGLSVDEIRTRVWANSRAHFRFSVHAGDEETWLRVHPGASPRQFERLCRVIRLLSEAGRPRVSTMHVIHKANFRNVREMVLHARELGVKEVLFRPVRTQGALTQLLPDHEEHAELHRQLRYGEKLAADYGIRTNLAEYMKNDLYIHSGRLQTWNLYRKIPCYIGWIYAEFDLDGTMRPCLNSKIVMGRADNQRLRDIWFSPRYRAFRRESRSLPEQDEPVKGCECDACCMAKFNVNIYNLLHFKSLKYSEA